MFEDHVSIDTGEGEMSTFVVHPEPSERRPGPFPTVLFLMDASGKREELHDMARRIASIGYYVLLPNLDYRDVPGFIVQRDDPGSRQFMFELMTNLSNAMVSRDAAALHRPTGWTARTTASCSRSGLCTTSRPPSVTGNRCWTCSPAACTEGAAQHG